MSLFEFDEDYYMELFKEEYWQEDYKEGYQEGYQETIEIGRQIVLALNISNSFALLKDVGLSEEDAIMKIAAQYQLPENEVRRILSDESLNR